MHCWRARAPACAPAAAAAAATSFALPRRACVQRCHGRARLDALLLQAHDYGESGQGCRWALARWRLVPWLESLGSSPRWELTLRPVATVPQTHVDLIEKLLNYNTLERQAAQPSNQ